MKTNTEAERFNVWAMVRMTERMLELAEQKAKAMSEETGMRITVSAVLRLALGKYLALKS